jgi:GTP-binding protein
MKVHHAEFALAAPSWKALPPPGAPEVAFVGRSNVGKSSLLNALLGRKQLARTSSTPGKTQAINFYAVNPDAEGAVDLLLVDLPGYGYAKVSQGQRAAWQRLVGRYVTERAEQGALRAVVQLVDSRHGITKMDEELLAVMLESPAPHLIALTKADKLKQNERKKAVRAIEEHLAPYGLSLPTMLTSAEKKRGLRELWGWIDAVVA